MAFSEESWAINGRSEGLSFKFDQVDVWLIVTPAATRPVRILSNNLVVELRVAGNKLKRRGSIKEKFFRSALAGYLHAGVPKGGELHRCETAGEANSGRVGKVGGELDALSQVSPGAISSKARSPARSNSDQLVLEIQISGLLIAEMGRDVTAQRESIVNCYAPLDRDG